jgi:predicted acetyltransferase
MVSLVPVRPPSRPALANLMQLYVHDWSELLPLDLDAEGRFASPPLDAYFRERDHHAFFIESDGKLAGFALVVARSRLTGAPGVHDVAEFFVARGYRRRGVGVSAAAALFARLAGDWEVRQRDENQAATAFWRRAIGQFTGGRYDEIRWTDERWTGIVHRFRSDAIEPGTDGAGRR